MIRHNIGLKIFSVLLALFIWIQSILVSHHKTTVKFVVNLTKLPAHIALEDVPKTLSFGVRGKGIDIIRLILKRANVDIDASNLRDGNLPITLTNYHIDIPENLDIEILKPAHEEELIVQTDVYESRTVPIEITFASLGARNAYQSGRYRISPETVRIYGPRRALDAIRQIRSNPITTVMLAEEKFEIELESPAVNISVLDPVITIELIDQEIQQRIIDNIPIRLEGNRQSTPNRVTIKVEGNKEAIQTLDLTMIRARVVPDPDVRGFKTVIVEVPNMIRLLDITPARVLVNER